MDTLKFLLSLISSFYSIVLKKKNSNHAHHYTYCLLAVWIAINLTKNLSFPWHPLQFYQSFLPYPPSKKVGAPLIDSRYSIEISFFFFFSPWFYSKKIKDTWSPDSFASKQENKQKKTTHRKHKHKKKTTHRKPKQQQTWFLQQFHRIPQVWVLKINGLP